MQHNSLNHILLKTFLLTGIALTVLCGCTSSGTEKIKSSVRNSTASLINILPESNEKRRYVAQIDDILQHSLLRTNFNGGIIIAKDGGIIYEKYFGTTAPHSKDSVTAETSFQIASTSKTLTSAAVLKLAQEGKLSLNDGVSKYFPSFPYEGVTIKTLLDHRSGLPNYLYYMEKGSWNKKQLATNTDILNTLINWHPPKSANADKRFQYCNTNYVLLALIIEKVSGVPYPQYMKENFFDPLGMNNTFVHTMDDNKTVVQSYQVNGALWPLDFSDGPYGDKNIYSTPQDLLKWSQALYEGQILNQQMIDSAFMPYSNEKPGTHNYGLGWRMLLMPSKKVIYHNGHWHGFNSAFARLPDEKATIIILSNRYNKTVYSTAKKLYDVFGNYDGKQDEGEE